MSKPAPAPVPTFANQDKLPRLPIPDLQATLKKYRYTLEAVLAPDELRKTDAAIQASLPMLEELQRRLQAHDATQENSWLEQWWYNLAYLSWRVPLMVNSNWWLFIRDDHLPYLEGKIVRMAKGTFTPWQIKRAAGLASNLLNYKELLDAGKIPAESTRAGPLCMDQYRHMFGVTRNPEPNMDVLRRGFPHPHSHIVVLARDQCFRVDLLDAQGRRLPLAALEHQLQVVVDTVTAADFVPDFPTPVLTAEHRDTWAKARAHLKSLSATNRDSLEVIETALFTLSLDDFAPSDNLDEGHRVIAHGLDGHNRWYDKALNLVITASGRGGCNGEHSPQDALTPAQMFEHVLHNEPARDPAGAATNPQLVPIRRLHFVADAEMQSYLAAAEKNNRALLTDSDIAVLIFNGYGSDFIKKQAKVSPDAYMQLVMQLAHRNLHGYLVPTYETASTRMYKHGRTETCRTLLPEVKRWADAMAAQPQSTALPAVERLKLFRAACAAHSKYIAEASKGMGVDRHLLGLRLVMKKGEKVPIFEDPAYTTSCTWRLSTSGLGARSYQVLYGTGFGCVAPNGYGINYFSGPGVMHFGIESKHSCPETSTDLFRLHILRALGEMKDMVEQGGAAAGEGKGKL